MTSASGAAFGSVRDARFAPLASASRDAPSALDRDVDVALLQRGDVARVFPGANFPADGRVLVGRTSANESAVTGESMPVEKGPGDAVVGGTANEGGAVLVLATGVGADSMLAKVCTMYSPNKLTDEWVSIMTPSLSDLTRDTIPFICFV